MSPLADISSVDLFAGAGGWDVAARQLGFDPLGIEIDARACETRSGAGFRTLQADIAVLDPTDYPCDFLIASPPCTAFSMAGKGRGRDAMTVYAAAMQHMRLGAAVDRGWLDRECADPTAHLVLEPLRWALALRPTLIACEQVPPVLPLWQLMADVLRIDGYSVWTGVLEAERYGVPQTRERAILMASRVGTVHPPRATHQRYVSGQPARHEETLDGEILPWVSMAEALGWGMAERPSISLTAGSNRQGGADPLDGGSGARRTLRRERERGAWHERPAYYQDNRSEAFNRGPVAVEHPAPTLGSNARLSTWVQRERSGDRSEEGFDPHANPSQTLTEKTRSWTVHRPATTVNGDSRISEPGHHNAHESGSQQKNAVRITVNEAAILQSFPPDFPWQGSRTAQFKQIGNAVPPGLAKPVLATLLKTR